jgi:hypothetical protein
LIVTVDSHPGFPGQNLAISSELRGLITRGSTGQKDETEETEARANSTILGHRSLARHYILTKVPETFDPLNDVIHFEDEIGNHGFDSAVCLIVKVPIPQKGFGL